MAMFRHSLATLVKGLLLSQVTVLTIPYIVGVWYSMTSDRYYEQQWLNRAIAHCKAMRAATNDPDLQDILDYTIRRYNKIGGWNVEVMPCFTPPDLLFRDVHVIGINCPNCPGITLDPDVLRMPLEDGTIVLIHEAMHDYWPYWGHGHISDRERKFFELSYTVMYPHLMEKPNGSR
ncbi:MAG: hypothetical protein ABFC88_12605 [Thermoguttaceae bacterium]